MLGRLQDPDIVEWIALHQDEVGPLAWRECPRAVLNADSLGRHPRGGHEGFRRREAILLSSSNSRVFVPATLNGATIRPHGNFDAHLMSATHAFLVAFHHQVRFVHGILWDTTARAPGADVARARVGT